MLALVARLGPVLTAAAVCVLLIANLIDINRNHTNLQKVAQQQVQAAAANGKVQSQLEALASGTQALALGGNPDAQRIVAVLKQNGVNIKGQ